MASYPRHATLHYTVCSPVKQKQTSDHRRTNDTEAQITRYQLVLSTGKKIFTVIHLTQEIMHKKFRIL